MKKFSLIAISLFIFIIGVGIAAAGDMNATVDDAPLHLQDHQCGTDEIDTSSSDVIEIDSDINVDASIANSSDSTPVIDNSKDSTVAVETQSKEPLKNNPTIINHSDVIHTHIDPGIKKMLSLEKDFAKYNNFFKKNYLKTMPNGKTFSNMDLILELYKHYSVEDTVIIATQVLRDNGVHITLPQVQTLLYQMMEGTVYSQENEMNASYYKGEIQKIDEYHNSINGEAKNYTDLFKQKDGKSLALCSSIKYSYFELIIEIYAKHSSIEDTVHIATQTLQNCGYNVTFASLEDTFNQMMQGTVKTQSDQLGAIAYYGLMNSIKIAHENGDINRVADLIFAKLSI